MRHFSVVFILLIFLTPYAQANLFSAGAITVIVADTTDQVEDYASSELADQKGLTIVAGTQMRRISHMVEAMKRIRDGALGTIQGGQCFRLGGGMRTWGPQQRDAAWSDMEWQLRRWLFMTWLSGDFIVEMHVHNLDIVNWAMG